jgi:putative ABC transport system permease protein
MTALFAVVLAVLLPVVVHDLVRRPTIARLAWRNLAARPTEAALVVGGALLGTALISAALVVGDSFDASIRDLARTRWGPVDQVVYLPDAGAQARAEAALATPALDDVDGVLAATVVDTAVSVGDGDQRRVEPSIRLLEVDVPAAWDLGGDPTATGLGDVRTAPPAGQVLINQRLAHRLDLGAGDTVEVHLDDRARPLVVAAVVPAVGLAGGADVLAAPGTLTSTLADPSAARFTVLVSNTGGVYGGAERTDAVTAAIAERLGPDVQVERVKADLLDAAAEEGAAMTELFSTIGGFSTLAGVLLVVNLFVMLAQERTSQLGLLRAVGLPRGHLLRAFAAEGACYGVAAAVVGTAVGLGVAEVIVRVTAGLVSGDDALAIRLAVEPRTLLSAFVIGFGISQATVVLTSLRISRVNIIRALRELPEPPRAGARRRAAALGALGVGGAAASYLLLGDEVPLVTLAAPPLGALAAVPLLGLALPRRVAVTAACLAALGWAGTVFGRRDDVMAEPELPLFLVQGVLLVGAAVVAASALDRVWPALVARLGRRNGLAARLGLAHPLARPGRTGLLLAMYALVLFTVTFLSAMSAVFGAQAPAFARQAGGGFDLVVDSNRAHPLDAAALAAGPAVADVAPVLRGSAEVLPVSGVTHPGRWPWSGFDAAILRRDPPPLVERDARYVDDTAALAAVVAGDAVLVPDWLGSGAGDRLAVRAADGSTVELAVAGTVAQGWLLDAGILAAAEVVRSLDATAAPTRSYLAVEVGFDADAVAAGLNAAFVERGADARSFGHLAREALANQDGFLGLLRGFLGLGLLVGIAGLGVVLVRGVRERRRQLGVLRAVGFPASVIRRSFVFEAAFVGVQGVAIGTGLGLFSAWQVLTRSTAFERDLTFVVPWIALSVVAVVALAASVAAAIVPARQAGRIPPAAALRLTG